MLVLVFFNEAKSQLVRRLAQTDAYSAYIQEQVPYDLAVQIGESARDEEVMLQEEFGASKIIYLRQPNGVLTWRSDRALPVIVYDRSLLELSVTEDDAPVIWLLSETPEKLGRTEKLFFENMELIAKVRKMPEVLKRRLQFEQVVALPVDMAPTLLSKGYLIHILASLDSVEEVERFNLMTEAYYGSQRRRIRSFSSLSLLQDIRAMGEMQNYIRVGIVLSCGIILSCIIGSIAWLEYSQESYLVALLKSFGTPAWMLFVHSFFENMVLVVTGLLITFFAWKPIYLALIGQMKDMKLQPLTSIQAESSDLFIIFASALISVFLAVLPIAVGLRKQTGLILQ